ncbi:MAG: hypothetical protein QS721_13050 [Candidatus Endonucleobacter sp. (ex Gigantidas childressi)]|nr:hypothetical protein [Candidatus Endonucleobacter sp. (ex Gigantidas childressi)]
MDSFVKERLLIVKIVFLSIYVFLRNGMDKLCHFYKNIHNVLSGMFLLLMLVFCQQVFSVVEDECNKEYESIESKKSRLKAMFFDNIMHAYSCWSSDNNAKTAVMGSTGIKMLNGESCLNNVSDIDIVARDKEGAASLITYLNTAIQSAMYSIKDDSLKNLVATGCRLIWGNKELSDKAPECGKITMFDIESDEPFAAVDVVVKDFGENDFTYVTCEYDFQPGCKIEDKDKVSVCVLTSLSYATIDVCSMKSQLEYFQEDKSDVEKTSEGFLKEVIYSCQNLHKIKKRFPYYKQIKKENSCDAQLMEKIDEVSSSYGGLLREINRQPKIIEIIHKKAFDFNYSLGESSGLCRSLTHAEWVNILGGGFFVKDSCSDEDGIPFSISDVINANDISKECFLNAEKKLQVKEVDAIRDSVTPEVVNSFVRQWIDKVIFTMFNDEGNSCQELSSLDLSHDVTDCIMCNKRIKSPALTKELKQFFSEKNPFVILALSTGMPFVIFSSKNNEEKVSAELCDKDYAWNKWPILMRILEKAGFFISAENTRFKDVMFFAESEKNSYYLCVEKFSRAKCMCPLLIAEDLLLDVGAFELGDYKVELSENTIPNRHAMATMTNVSSLDEKTTKGNDCNEYMQLVEKCGFICLGQGNEVMSNTNKQQKVHVDKGRSNNKPKSDINKDNYISSDADISSMLKTALLSVSLDEEVDVLVKALSDISLGNGSDDVVMIESPLLEQNTKKQQKRKHDNNTNKVNKLMKTVLDTVNEHGQQDQRVTVNVNKCSSVMKELSCADKLGCPLAPLIIGVYQMTKLDDKDIYNKDVSNIIKYFIKAAVRSNMQGVACLYWLAEVTGSSEAFSSSISLSTIFNKCFSNKIVPLNFIWPQKESSRLTKAYDISLPLLLGRCSSQGNIADTCKVLSEAYHRYGELGWVLSEWELDQSASLVDNISYASYLAFFYLYNGDKKKSFLEFRKAAYSYAWLAGKTDDMSMIPNITKAAGWASMYHVINCENDSGGDENYFSFYLGKERNFFDLLWALKSIVCGNITSPVFHLASRIYYFNVKKNEGVVFGNSDELENEMIERNGFFDCNLFKQYQCYVAADRLKLSTPSLGVGSNVHGNSRKGRKEAQGHVDHSTHKLSYKGKKGSQKKKRGITDSETSVHLKWFGSKAVKYASLLNKIYKDDKKHEKNGELNSDLYKKTDEKFIGMFNDLVSDLSIVYLMNNPASMKNVSIMFYKLLFKYFPRMIKYNTCHKFDNYTGGKVLELVSMVFKEDGSFDSFLEEGTFNTLVFKCYCLVLLNPGNYENINTDMQVRLIKSLLVNMRPFAKTLGVDMNKVNGEDVQRVLSGQVVKLFYAVIDYVDDRELFLLVIDVVCQVIIVRGCEDLLSKALFSYFIRVENDIDSGNRENAYKEVEKYLMHANDTGRIGEEICSAWRRLAIYPYQCARVKIAEEKECSANLSAQDLIQEEEREKIEMERKHRYKQDAILRMLNGNICRVTKGVEECSHTRSFVIDERDGQASLQSGEGSNSGNEENKVLTGLYEKISNKDFKGAFDGFCKCEGDDTAKSGGVKGVHWARINILKFECLIELVKYNCSTFKCSYSHYKTTEAYLRKFKSAEESDRLPVDVSAEQLKDSYTKLLPIISDLKAKDGKLEQAIKYANMAENTLRRLDEKEGNELELLFLQKAQLNDSIVNIGKSCQNISDILVIRKKILKNIRDKNMDCGVEKKRTITIDANSFLVECKDAVRCLEKLKKDLLVLINVDGSN